MATRPALVNKQFNSPIRLYSPANVAETLNKQTQVLANGAVGIDFHNLAKPANLANSAVLRMLEEEANQRSRATELKRVAWPPPPEEQDELTQPDGLQEPVFSQAPAGNRQQASPFKHVQSPQPSQPLRDQRISPQPYTPPPHQAYQPVHFEPPPTTITLRPIAPITQAPPPVFTSQPATASIRGGARMRGDQKWPPDIVKQQTAAENEARILLAKGPAFRPRKVKKDYSEFFAQHALNSTYPGYKVPPGTQHYIEEGTSNL